MSLYDHILKSKIFFILGPCVIDTEDNAQKIAKKLTEIKDKYQVPIIFKASFDKANRQSVDSYRGPGLKKGLEILKIIKEKFALPVLTDIHESSQASSMNFVDIVQIPAFLCRQTDLLIAAGKTNAIFNIKKGQFVSSEQMTDSVAKVISSGNKKVMLTERGTFFGYGDLVVDFRNISKMKKTGFPVVFDATHSVQRPGANKNCSGGEREFVKPLACASLEFGAKGVFMEVHPEPSKALCDGPNSLDFNMLDDTVEEIMKRINGAYNV